MKTITKLKQSLPALSLLAALMTVSFGGVASALEIGKPVTPIGTTSNDSARVSAIISAGDREIARRLTTLGTLTSKINSAKHLSSSDQSTLSGEVNSEISGLTSLKTTLDAETTLDGAKTDAESIISDYRVYALIVPKVQLIKVADDQQVVEGQLTTMATALQSRLTTAQNADKDVSSLQTTLSDMTSKTQAAQSISSTIETKVVALQPSDYNTDHTILSGDSAQLKTARSDNQAAYADAKNIVAALAKL